MQLDSLPFHLMIHQRGQRYHFELRFWENRFDTAQMDIFMTAMESIIEAMFTEPSVRRLAKHLPGNLYPTHIHVTAKHLNELAGFELVEDDSDKEISVYVLDERYLKKPFAAWGELFIMDTPVKNARDSVTFPYGDGILYDTGITARILPDGSLDFLENSGRSILWESPKGNLFPDLHKIEEALLSVKGVKEAEAWLGLYDECAMKLSAEITSDKEIDTAILQEAVKEQVGEDFVPEVITFK